MIRYLLIILLSTFTINAYSQDLYFAGFSFIGNATEDANYPVAMEIYKNDPRILNQKLIEALKKLKRTDLNIISDSQGFIKNGNAVALAYGLQKESWSSVHIEGGYQTKLEVYGEVYVFDYSDNEHKLIVNYPSASFLTVTSKQKLTDQEVRKYFENMYIPNRNSTPYQTTSDAVGGDSVFDSWVSRLEQAKISRAKKDLRLQIRNVVLEDAVLNQLPVNSYYIKDKSVLIAETARNLERTLSSNQNVPVLPYSIGRAIGSSMLARFSDTNFDIKIPPADYVLDVTVREFKKGFDDNKGFDGFVYGAFVTLKVIQPDLNDVKLESKFNYKTEIKSPKGYKASIEDDWPLWMGSQKKIFEILTTQISLRNDQEISRITSTANIKEQLKSFETVINNCK